ncbi:MAG: DUF2029 domain-containing protein [Leptospira sp.]|nr:DUF2029 domain-containing protein [Leptospira sp.]
MPEKINKLFPYLCAILLIALFFQGVSRIDDKSDFRDYFNASKLFRLGQDIYQVEIVRKLRDSIKLEDAFKLENLIRLEELKNSVGTYIYPPTFAFLLIPLTFFSYNTASAIFYFLNFLSLCLSIFLISKIIRTEKFFLILFFTLLLSYRFLENHINNNQVSFLLIFLTLFALRTDNKFLSATILSLAIVIKLTPAIFILFFFLKRDFVTPALTFGFLLLWIFIPSLAGHEFNLAMLRNWYDLVLNNFMQNPEFRAWKNNQSLVATLAKYFLSSADPLNQSMYGLPLNDFSARTVKMLFYLFSISLLGFMGYRLRKGLEQNQIIAGLFILSVILSGISWVHSFVVLIFPLFYGISRIVKPPVARHTKVLFTIGGILPILTARMISGSYIESLSLMYSIVLYSSILIYISVLNFDPDETRIKI